MTVKPPQKKNDCFTGQNPICPRTVKRSVKFSLNKFNGSSTVISAVNVNVAPAQYTCPSVNGRLCIGLYSFTALPLLVDNPHPRASALRRDWRASTGAKRLGKPKG